MNSFKAARIPVRLISMVVLLAICGIATAHATNFLNQIQNSYQTASSSWMNGAIKTARDIFALAVGAEFVWWGVQRLLRGGEVHELLTGVMMKVVTLGFFFTFMTYAPQWIPDIVHSFSDIGQQLGGSSTSTPSGVFDLGIGVANQLIQSLVTPGLSLSAIGKFVLSAIIVGLSALVVVIAYGIIALQLLITNIESYIVLGAGVVFSGFFGSRWTLPFAEKYIGYAVHVGIKLMVLYLIVGLGPTVANDATSFIKTFHAAAGSGYPPLADYLNVGIGSLIFGVIGYMIPSLAGSLMSGTPSMSMGNTMPAAAAVGGATVAAPAAAIGTAAALAGGGLAGAAAIANRTISAARGAGNSISGGGGLGSAISGLIGKSAAGAPGSGMKTAGTSTQAASKSGTGSGLIDTSTSLGSAIKQQGQRTGGNTGSLGLTKAGRSGADQPTTASGSDSTVPSKGSTDSLGGGQTQGATDGSGETGKPTISQRFQSVGNYVKESGKYLSKEASMISPDPRRTPHDGNTGGGIGIRFKHHDE